MCLNGFYWLTGSLLTDVIAAVCWSQVLWVPVFSVCKRTRNHPETSNDLVNLHIFRNDIHIRYQHYHDVSRGDLALSEEIRREYWFAFGPNFLLYYFSRKCTPVFLLSQRRVDLAHLVLYHLSLCCKRKYFDFDHEIMSFTNENWESLLLGAVCLFPYQCYDEITWNAGNHFVFRTRSL